MRRTTCLAVAAIAATVFMLPAGADPAAQVVDPAGDANALNGQALVTGGAADGTATPADYAGADLLSVTYSTTYEEEPVGDDGVTYVATGVEARIVTSAPPTSDGPTLIYRLDATVGGCGGFLQYYLRGPAAAPTDGTGLEFRQFANRGCTANATIGSAAWSGTVEDSALVLRFPYQGMAPAERLYFGVGKFLSTHKAEVRTQLGLATAPAIDITQPGTEFKIGSDVPKNVPCTTGCP